MDRINDKTLRGLITGFEMSMHDGIGAKGVENILSALTELRERREAEKDYRKALDAARIEIMRGYSNEKQD